MPNNQPKPEPKPLGAAREASALDKTRVAVTYALAVVERAPLDVYSADAIARSLTEALRQLSIIEDRASASPERAGEPQELILNVGGLH